MEFEAFPKIPRMSRDIVITEKLDGTNASIFIGQGVGPLGALAQKDGVWMAKDDLWMVAGSRTRWICPSDDNYGFAVWARDNADELFGLGVGHHFGEWWGRGIQRNYSQPERHFSLFNTGRWARLGCEPLDGQTIAPLCCSVVPTLYRGLFGQAPIEKAVTELRIYGSRAAPGFMDPEGIVVYHTAAGQMFKKTLKGDGQPKGALHDVH